jgi:CheY-like chemotaxis protein
MNILIVEDSHAMARAMTSLLVQQGHNVTWVVGLASLSTAAQCSAVDGMVEQDHSGRRDVCSVSFTDIDVAFVDGQIEGSFQGEQVTEHLSAHGVKVLAISTQDDLNEKMVAKGARFGLKKPVAFVGLFSRILSPELVSDEHALSKQEYTQLKRMEQKLLSSEFEAVRKQADAYFMPYLMADV